MEKLSSPLLGLAQVNLQADDVSQARDWYADFLGIEPYFQRPDADHPAYVEFRVGGHLDELGIIARAYLPEPMRISPGGVVARWHVADVAATVARLVELGAREAEPITEREEGFVTASVIDPFGNVLGLLHSPHYEATHQAAQGSREN